VAYNVIELWENKSIQFLYEKEGAYMGKIHTQYLTDEKGKKTAVVIPVEEYEEILEDIHDLAVIAERRDEPVIPIDELKKRLKADGLL